MVFAWWSTKDFCFIGGTTANGEDSATKFHRISQCTKHPGFHIKPLDNRKPKPWPKPMLQSVTRDGCCYRQHDNTTEQSTLLVSVPSLPARPEAADFTPLACFPKFFAASFILWLHTAPCVAMAIRRSLAISCTSTDG